MATDGLTAFPIDVRSTANLSYQFKDTSFDDLADVAESLAKSYGIYLEFNRALTGNEKEWVFMVRITIPGGGPITREQWAVLDDVSEKYTQSDSYQGDKKLPSLRITTRQNIQLHWVKKKDLVEAISEIGKSGFYTINGCGDNVRNVTGCPLSHFSKIFNANSWAQKTGKYFRLPTSAYMEIFSIDPNYLRKEGEKVPSGDDDSGDQSHFQYGSNLLNRKFKLGFSSILYDETSKKYRQDNCVEVRTNDVGIAPIFEESSKKVSRFQVYIGGSQGEKAGFPTYAASGVPLGVFCENELLSGLDAIVRVHKDWGDRQNRHWARLKYVLYKKGIDWFRDQVREKSGINFEPPIENFDFGAREMHHSWIKQDYPEGGLWSYGAFIENGRLINSSPNGELKKLVRHLMDSYNGIVLLTTPNQDLIFGNIEEDLKAKFESDLSKHGFGRRNGVHYSRLRKLSGACVGRDTCRLTYTDSEKFQPFLIDELESKWGDLAESIGITGCERQCFRPATKTIGWVGSGFNLYSLKLGGSEDARAQGGSLVDPRTGEIYMKTVPRKDVATVTDALFEFYVSNRTTEEAQSGGMGYFIRRVGASAVIEYLKTNPKTANLMARTAKNPLAEERLLVNPSLGSSPPAK